MAKESVSNVERLQQEGILETENLSDAQRAQLDTLTAAEVDALISIRGRLDTFGWPIKPNMF